MSTDRLLLRPAEAAEMLGLSQRMVYELCGRGELPSVRVGRAVRVPVEGLRQWVESHTQAGIDREEGELLARYDRGPALHRLA